jgi:hypothetical protein
MDLDELRPLSPPVRHLSHESTPTPTPATGVFDEDDDMYLDPGSHQGQPDRTLPNRTSFPDSGTEGLRNAPTPPRTASQGSDSAASSASASSGHKRNHSSIDELGNLELPPLEVPKKPKARRVTRPASDDDYEEDEIRVIEPPLKQAKGRSTRGTRQAPTAQQAVEVIDVDEDDLAESVAIIPNKKARQEAVANGGPDVEYVPRKGETEVVKKKKRCACVCYLHLHTY